MDTNVAGVEGLLVFYGLAMVGMVFAVIHQARRKRLQEEHDRTDLARKIAEEIRRGPR